MPNADSPHQRRTADTCVIVQLVDHSRVCDEAPAAGNVLCYLVGNDATEVAGVLVYGLSGIVEHLVVNLIDASRQWFGESATANYGLKIKVDVHPFQFGNNEFFTECELVGNVLELAQFLCRVGNRPQQHRTFILINGHLGRCGAGIYY